jgi:mRNA-degrading endonuclease RelE of RelBE toxin-antitoxin system
MKVLIDKSFVRDTSENTNKKILNSVGSCIEDIRDIGKLSDIPNCKKLKRSKNAYRIKIGDYRIGFVFEEQTVIFIRFLHRSKIYQNFPQ